MMLEKLTIWIAWRVPRSVAYWCAVRVGVYATIGPYAHEEVPALKFVDALQRWDRVQGA